MRVLLVAEGKHEFHGALETLVRRLLPLGTTVTEFQKLKLSDPQIRHVTGKGPKLTRRILSALREAEKRGCDALVLLLDEDGDSERRKHVDAAQDSAALSLQRAIGIAIRTFDAWMLADETALTDALSAPVPVQCQPNPESIAAPKERFAAIHQGANCPLAVHEAYANVAAVVRLEILAARCPDGFAPFAQRIRQLRG